MTHSEKIKRVVFYADRVEHREAIKKAKKNARFYIPHKRATRCGWDCVYCRIYGTLNQIAKLLNQDPQKIADEMARDYYRVYLIQYVKR